MERYQEIERSIITKYRKTIWSKFVSSVQDYDLIKENDKVMVCISGGKDSFLLAKCIEELQKHGKVPFEAKYVVMNPGFLSGNLERIKENAEILHVPIEIFETDIFPVVSHLTEGNPCYLCARMRRGHLYNKAKELGCNKIALGHHFDDVIETTLLSLFYGAEIKTMMPKLKSDHFEGLELIRPLYKVKEEAISSFAKYHHLEFIHCGCPLSSTCSVDASGSKRQEMKELIKKLREVDESIDHNIFKALENVNLNCVLGTRKDGVYESFLDTYH